MNKLILAATMLIATPAVAQNWTTLRSTSGQCKAQATYTDNLRISIESDRVTVTDRRLSRIARVRIVFDGGPYSTLSNNGSAVFRGQTIVDAAIRANTATIAVNGRQIGVYSLENSSAGYRAVVACASQRIIRTR